MYPSPQRPYSGIYIHRQLKELRRRGYGIEVLNPVPWIPQIASRFTVRPSTGLMPQRYMMDDIPVYRVPALPLWGAQAARFNGPAYLPSLLPVAAMRHRRRGFDALYGHELHRTGFNAVVIGKALNLPSIAMGHGSDVHTLPLHDSVIGSMVNWTVRNADRVVVSSGNLRDILLGMQPQREDSLFVNPGCIDAADYSGNDMPVASVRSEYGLPVDKRIALFVGRVMSRKGIEDLLQAAYLLHQQHRDIHIALVGPCDDMPQLHTMIHSMNLEPHVTCTGVVPPASISRIMRASDVLVLPSHCEGSPVSIMEAMAASLPVVGTTVGGIPDMLDHGAAGYLVRPRDVKALATAIHDALAKSRKNQQRIDMAYRKAHTEYTSAANADRFETILDTFK